MYNDCNSSLKRKLDKMNMVLNNIQHLLSEHVGLCKEVDRVIEMSCECKKVVDQLKLLKTNIPALEKRINTLLLDCISSCNEAKEILLLKIENYLLVKQKKVIKT